ncbi:hypothetical protein IQ247_18195 [Plectonema cf. radiosum LEGE 06105]|uniref:PEP-CTERM sorting domain-containing protein n=1 Tax=Plectonema cf. radiosum LEGE 06105 TaxID=945769 RepID=A0A8J7F402_9CYAN|nr:hypothetical protein [Plectonema radiosum]MBE9214575.1 hypothetical protein [Plectonema cf. radiosum LEGE 06105]
MRTYQISAFLFTTPLLSFVIAPASVKAATFNFDQLRFIEPRPIESNVFLDFQGLPSQNEGFVAFYNQDADALDRGHRLVPLNSRADIPGVPDNAPYYGTGRQGSPEVPSTNATRTASLVNNSGFSNFNSYLTNNGIEFSDIGFAFGQKEGQDFTKTWNLGADVIGENWFAEPDSPIEERIYSANPNDVELGLYNGTTKIIDFGYSDYYAVVDYGPTTSFQDDIESNFTDPITVNKVPNLSSFNQGLADAFVKDVSAAGNRVQIVNSFDGDDLFQRSGNGFDMFILPFPLELRVVRAVPEKSLTWTLLMFGVLAAISRRKKASNQVECKRFLSK